DQIRSLERCLLHDRSSTETGSRSAILRCRGCAISGLMHRRTQLPYPITSSVSCPRRNPALPRAPHRGRETRLAGRHLVWPTDDLFAGLPLDRHRFVSSLVAALIDGEIAKDRLRLEGQ